MKFSFVRPAPVKFLRTAPLKMLAGTSLAAALAVAACPSASAQEPASAPQAVAAQAPLSFAMNETPRTSSSSLPDAPSAVSTADADTVSAETPLAASLPPAEYAEAPKPGVAPKYAKYIASTETAQKIDAHDKVILGFRDLYSFENLLAIVASAGYEQVTNNVPNYIGSPYAKRVGAAAARESSQGIFTDAVFAPLLHIDPRYYAQGADSGFFHRFFYAGTRVLVGKTDSGRATINSPLLLGYAVSAAITPAYYPQVNRNFDDIASGYGGSLGGAAIGFLFSEFSDSILQTLHLEKRP